MGINENVKADDLERALQHKALLRACKVSFEGGEYWDAVSNAMRHLEEAIRKKAILSSDDVGTDLVTKAFNPKTGELIVPSCATFSEKEGFHLILRGIVQFHRNAKAHREGTIDGRLAFEIICYVDYLLSIIDSAGLRKDSQGLAKFLE